MKQNSRQFRSYKKIHQYISREFFLSFTVAFFFFFFIFFINQLLLLAEDILAKKVPILSVLKLILYSMPSIIALSFPFATLVGTLMTFGRFSSDNEILAMKCSGIRNITIFSPVLLIGCLFSLLSFFVNDYLLPLGTINFSRLYTDLIYNNPELELEPYSVKHFQDTTIITGGVEEGVFKNLIIVRDNRDGNREIILSDKGVLSKSYGARGLISFNLDKILTHESSRFKEGEYSYTLADRMVYNIALQNISSSILNPGPREMMSKDLYRSIKEKEANFLPEKERALKGRTLSFLSLYIDYFSGKTPDNIESYESLIDVKQKRKSKIFDKTIQIWKLELYQKFSIPFSCLPFVILAFPLGLFSKRSGRSVGFGIGLLITVLYWGMLIAGRTLGIRSDFSPFLTMWIPNLLILLIGIILNIVKVKR